MNDIHPEAFDYRLYIPGGNMTALVDRLERDAQKRITIQDIIMRKHAEVEQVGFIGCDARDPELIMAGGEFCGNATRAAAWHFLGGKPGEITILVSGVKNPLKAGVTDGLEAWVEIPAGGGSTKIDYFGEGMDFIEMEGISHLVLTPDASEKYLRLPRGANLAEHLMHNAEKLLSCMRHAGKSPTNVNTTEIAPPSSGHSDEFPRAIGVIYTEAPGDAIKIHPCVFVKSSGTAFYETACGSGSAAVAIAKSARLGRDVDIQLLQPSGLFIRATACIAGDKTTGATQTLRATISGPMIEII